MTLAQLPQLHSEFDQLPTAQRVLNLARALCSYLKTQHHIDVEPCRNPEKFYSHFESLPLERQNQIFRSLLDYYLFCSSIIEKNIPITNKKLSLKDFFAQRKIRVNFDIESLMTDDVVVEAYDMNSVQFYRSVDFYTLTSHDVLEMMSYPWWELYMRADQINKEILEKVTSIYMGQCQGPIFDPVPRYTIKEIGPKPICSDIESKVFAPLYTEDGQLAGAIHLFKVYSTKQINFSVVH